jgi:hypothetical protein
MWGHAPLHVQTGQGAANSDAQLARERAADAAYKDLVKRKQHLKDGVRSNKRAFEETGVEEIDSEDSLGVGELLS